MSNRRPFGALRTAAVCGALLLPADLGLGQCFEALGTWRPPGEVTAVAVDGGHTFIGTTTGLLVVDIADVAAPVVLGRLPVPQPVTGIVVRPERVFLAAGSAGLRVVDVSDPSAPIETAVVDIGSAAYIDLSGEFAYVSSTGSLHVVDISNPDAPVVVGWLPVTAYSVEVVGHHAYLGGWWLNVIDVSDPTTPIKIGELATVEPVTDLAYSPPYLYLANDLRGIRRVDISDPGSPLIVSSFTPGEPGTRVRRIEASNGFAYAAVEYRDRDVLVIDLAGSMDQVGLIEDVAAEDPTVDAGSLFLPDISYGLRIFDISDPSDPLPAGSLPVPQRIADAAVAGEMIFVAAEAAGLRVLDASDPSSLSEIGNVLTGSGADHVAVAGHRGVAVGRNSGLHVVDLSDPSQPHVVGSLTEGEFGTIELEGNHGFMGVQSGLRVVDLSDPAHPFEVGFVPMPAFGQPYSVDLGDGFASVARKWDTPLVKVDVSNPASPIWAGSAQISPYLVNFATGSTYVYVAGGDGLHVLDSSGWPIEIGRYDEHPLIYPRLSGSFLYGSEGSSPPPPFPELSRSTRIVLNVSAPATPALVIRESSTGGSVVSIDGGRLYAKLSSEVTVLSTCLVFFDGFDRGDTSSWTMTTP